MSNSGLRNFPLVLTSFVGRGTEIDQVASMVKEHRLVSLVGPGGVGKTRLAAKSVGHLGFHDGAWFIDLSLTRDGEMVPSLVAEPFDIGDIDTGQSRSLFEVLVDYLSSKEILLVLDNCEHVHGPVKQLVIDLLARCPDLTVLTTTRVPLAIDGEIVFRVSPLGVTAVSGARPDAVSLFLDRLAQIDATYQPEGSEMEAVAEIVTRLDGLPLAIELAASRAKLLAPSQILQEIAERMLQLEGKAGAAGRHETLHATIAWSYDLLKPEEQNSLHRLSIFSGWSLDAAEAILGLSALELLTGLVDKSLVDVVTGDRENRYRMLETVREFGIERLGDSGDEDEARQAHADYYLHLAEDSSVALVGEQQAEWLSKVRADHDNIRGVLGWALDTGRGDLALRMVAAMGRYWFMATQWAHALDWYRRATEIGRDDHPLLWARAYLNTGTIKLITQTETDPTDAESASEIIAREGTTSELARATYAVAEVGLARGGTEEPIAESIRLASEAGDPWMEAYVKRWLGSKVELVGDPLVNIAHQREAVDTFISLGDRWSAGWISFDLGYSQLAVERFQDARESFRHALALVADIDDRLVRSHAIRGLASVALGLGQYEEARELFEESIPMFERIGDDNCISFARMYLADVGVATGDEAGVIELLDSAFQGFIRVDNDAAVGAAMRRLADRAFSQEKNEIAVQLLGSANTAGGGVDLLSPGEHARAQAVVERGLAVFTAEEMQALVAQGEQIEPSRMVSEALSRLVGSPAPTSAAQSLQTTPKSTSSGWPPAHTGLVDYIRDEWEVRGDIHILRTLGGKSGAAVLAVDLTCKGHDGQAILKLEDRESADPAELEARRHHLAWEKSPGFAAEHIPRLVQTAERTEATAILLTIASRGLEYTVPWASTDYRAQAETGAQLVKDILYEWNRDYLLSEEVMTPAQTLAGWLDYRLDPNRGRIHGFMEDLGVDPLTSTLVWDGHWYPNPLSFAAGVGPKSGAKLRPLIGNVHGDLHGHNVLVRTRDPGLPWFLIDLAFYDPDGFLFFDHAYFELSHLLETRSTSSLKQFEMIVRATYGRTEPASDDIGLVALMKSMRDGIWEWVEEHEPERLAAVEAQMHLARVAVGLNFTHKRVPAQLKTRAFMYAMVALKEYLRFQGVEWPRQGILLSFGD